MRKSIITALLAAALAAAPLMAEQRPEAGLQDGAPDHYVVVPGDSLWSIAAKFLKDRWRWHFLLKSSRPATLTRVVRYVAEKCPIARIAGMRLVVDRDPVALL